MDAACTTASHVVVPSTDAHAAAATVAAAREATSLRAWAARLGKDQGAITASLAAVTRLLDAAMAAGAADVAVGVKGAVADAAMGLLKAGRRRPYYYRAVYPSSHGVGAGGEGAAAAAPAAAAPAAAEEQKAAKEEEAAELLEEEEEQATSVDLAAVEVELCLEWALLSREAGKRQDFVSAALALVELAVYQSKSEFRRARKKRRACFERIVWFEEGVGLWDGMV